MDLEVLDVKNCEPHSCYEACHKVVIRVGRSLSGS